MSRIVVVVVAALLWLALWFAVGHVVGKALADSPLPPQPAMTVRITTFNPYTFSARLELKCDWDGRKGAYGFHRFITVRGKGATLVDVPNNMKSCEIWPKILF